MNPLFVLIALAAMSAIVLILAARSLEHSTSYGRRFGNSFVIGIVTPLLVILLAIIVSTWCGLPHDFGRG